MKELYLNNQKVDLKESSPIQYNFQVNDIGDVESRQATFTNTIELPMTPNNIRIMEGLGIVGDNSSMPYQKIKADLFEFTIPVITDGWAVISNTNDKYNLNLYSGIIDLFKAIENKTIGKDLDISETTHDKDLISVSNSFTNNTYRYIIADYNGKKNIPRYIVPHVNIDYLVPSISCKYLMDKIQATFGFEFIGSVFSSPKYLNWWMTYPKPATETEDDETPIEIKEVATGSITSFEIDNSVGLPEDIFYDIPFNPKSAIEGTWATNSKYIVLSNGTYSFVSSGDALADYQYEDNFNNPLHKDFYQSKISIFINGVDSGKYLFINNNIVHTISVSLRAGDEVEFKYEEVYENKPNWFLYNLKIFNLSLSIKQISSGQIIFQDALIEFSIKDFFKEFLWLFGLTPIPLQENKILFLTTDERINAPVVDWSDKYNGRTNEQYIYGNYAQRNWLKHKYNDDNANYNDGFFTIENQNLEAEKDVIQSKVYTPEKSKEPLVINSNYSMNSNVYPIWEKEPVEKNDNEGNTFTEIKYKDLNNRYYFLRSIDNPETINLASRNLSDEISVVGFPQEDYSDLKYAEVTSSEYQSLNALINHSRIHSIKLKNLSPVDIQNLRYDVVYYFEQEQQYYILNKLPYQADNENTGEFIRIKF